MPLGFLRVGYNPGDLGRSKLPCCLCQERDALPSHSPAPEQLWQEMVETAGFLSAKAEQMFPARSHSCPEQLTAHTWQRKGSQGNSSPVVIWRYLGDIICCKQINVCSCSSWHITRSGSTGFLFVPSGRGQLLWLGGQHFIHCPSGACLHPELWHWVMNCLFPITLPGVITVLTGACGRNTERICHPLTLQGFLLIRGIHECLPTLKAFIEIFVGALAELEILISPGYPSTLACTYSEPWL